MFVLKFKTVAIDRSTTLLSCIGVIDARPELRERGAENSLIL